MSEYIITLKDNEDGMSVNLAGPADESSTAYTVAQVVMQFIPEIVKRAAQAPCECEQCKARRQADAPTLH